MQGQTEERCEAHRVSSVRTLFSNPTISSLNSLNLCFAAGRSLCSSFIFDTYEQCCHQSRFDERAKFRNPHFTFLRLNLPTLLISGSPQTRQILFHRSDLLELQSVSANRSFSSDSGALERGKLTDIECYVQHRRALHVLDNRTVVISLLIHPTRSEEGSASPRWNIAN